MNRCLIAAVCIGLVNPLVAQAAGPTKSKAKSQAKSADPPAAAAQAEAKPAEAAPSQPEPEKESKPAATTQIDLEQARKLYYEGETRFELHDYKGAIDKWTEAYGSLPDNEQTAQHKNDLAYNIAVAHEQAYELDKDPAHLHQAHKLLSEYVERFTELHEPTEQNKKDYAAAVRRMTELKQRIESDKIAGGPTQPQPVASVNPAVLRRQRYKQMLADDPDYRSGRGMMVGGAVLLGVGTPLLIGTIAYIERGKAVPLAVLGAISGGLTVAGIALLAVGVPKFKRAKRRAWDKSAIDVGAVPTVDLAGSYGVSIIGRFNQPRLPSVTDPKRTGTSYAHAEDFTGLRLHSGETAPSSIDGGPYA